MPNDFMTLLELSKQKGTDTEIGIVEEVTTYAPELDTIRGREITGISNLIAVRTALPSGPAFRHANEGTNIGKSTHQQKRFDTFFFDALMQIDEAVVKAGRAQTGKPDSVFQAEAAGVMKAKAIALGAQLYTGGDAKGYPALSAFLDPALDVDAGGSGTVTDAWFIRNAPGGVEFIYSAGGIKLGDWFRQQVIDPADSTKRFMAWCNNLSGFIGLQCGASYSVGRIKNITAAKPLTDDLAEDLLAKFPTGLQPNLCFANRQTRRGLRKSRSVTVVANLADGRADTGDFQGTAPMPEEVAGVPLVVTDLSLIHI